jgi:hypothetical protein
MKIFRYIVPVDDGAAPNPYGGVCTLAICKPNIRKIAKVGDWLIGLKNPTKELIYCMKITDVMSMQEYDKYTKEKLPIKIPDTDNKDITFHMGDSVYDFSKEEIFLRKSVHSRCTKQMDLDGKNVLLSNHFYYFGDKAIKLEKKFTEDIDTSIDFDYLESFLLDELLFYFNKNNININILYSTPNICGIISPSNREFEMSCCIRKKIERQFYF